MKYYIDSFKNYANLKDRTTRKEYWLFMLTNILIFLIIQLIGVNINFPVLGYLYVIFSVIPVTSSSARRLIDAGKSKLWLFATLLFPVGTLIVVCFLCLKSRKN